MLGGWVLCYPIFGDEGNIYPFVTSDTDWIFASVTTRFLKAQFWKIRHIELEYDGSDKDSRLAVTNHLNQLAFLCFLTWLRGVM